MGGGATKGLKEATNNLDDGIKKVGEKVKSAIKKKLDDVDEFMKTPEFQKIVDDAWKRYKKNMPKEQWEQMYKNLYRNKEKGTITEKTFEELMGGNPISLDAGQLGRRDIDNFYNGIAREVKSGYLKADDFTKKQIQKDIYLLLNPSNEIKRIEWHLFGGADKSIIEILNSAQERLGKDKFNFTIY